MFSSLQHFFLEALFPTSCVLCNKEGGSICDSCEKSVPVQLACWCTHCARVAEHPSNHKHTFAFDALYSLFAYQQKGVASAMHSVKFGGYFSVAQTLGTLLAERLESAVGNDAEHWSVTNIPLHPRRKRERGFDQAEQLAKAFSNASGVPFIPLLTRTRSTSQQAKLGATERQKNIAGAFAFRSEQKLSTTQKSVLLMDDVATTGATLNEAARVLKSAGAEKVVALTVAYAVLEKARPQT